MKINWFIFCLSMSVLFGIFYSADGTRKTSYNDCLTWQDDKNYLQLICRVSDFFTPVIFFHYETQIEVNCKIKEYERGCTPRVTTLSINEYNNTVTLVLKEQKDGRNLDGKWYCKQGIITHSTEVSFSKGIIADSSIYLRGTVVNKSRYLNVECSSCRIPKGPYAEISINGKTKGSLRQTNEGCFYNYNTPCSESNVCQCTETKNAFSLRLQLPVANNSSNISCYMHFVDTLRNIKYFVTASHAFNGKDFRETGKDITILTYLNSRSTGLPTVKTTSIQSATIEPTNIIEPIGTTPNVKSSWLKENLATVIVSAIALVIILGLTGLLFYMWTMYKSKKTQNKQQYEVVYLKKEEEEDETYESIDTCIDETKALVLECNNCKSCQQNSKEDIDCLFCFNCLRIFCSKCIVGFDHELHINVPISDFPSFVDPVIFFTCHDECCFEYFCQNHKKLYCTKCKDYHLNCITEPIDSISIESIKSDYEVHMSELKTFKETLDAYHKWLREGHKEYKRKAQENLKLLSFQQDMQKKYNNDTARYETGIKKLITKIETNQKFLKLIYKEAYSSHMFIVLQKLKDELVLIEKKVDVFGKSFYRLVRSGRDTNTK